MKMKQRILSLLLTACLIVWLIPTAAFAAEDSGATIGTSGLCEHHTAHNEACGYVEGTAGTPCTHEHTEDCYKQAESCTHEHTADCYPVTDSGVSGNEATPSDAAESTECGHVCSVDSGCIVRELNCPHEHDDQCGYVPAVEAQPCGYECAECAAEAETNVGQPEEKIASVQSLIDALPETVTKDNAGDVEAQLEAIDKAKAQLSDEELAQLDFSRYTETAAALEQLLYGAATPSHAVMPIDYNGPAIVVGTSGISDPTEVIDQSDNSKKHYTPNSYLYFGTNSGTPIKWRVLDADKANDGSTAGMFLLSEYVLASELQFNTPYSRYNAWQGSDAQEWCSNFATNTSNFSAAEWAAMLGVAKTDNAEDNLYDYKWVESSLTTNDKLFFLSVREFADYVGNYDGAPPAKGAGDWWLRSPYAVGAVSVGVVYNNGLVYTSCVNIASGGWAARPAFNLDLNSVLFTSAADNSAHRSFAAPANYSGSEWKVTLKDSNNFAEGASVSSTNVATGDMLTITHKAISSFTDAGYTNVTAMLTNSSGEVLYYGSINTEQLATSSSITIPTGIESGTYTLSVYGEDWNGEKLTDYATGTPFTTSLTIHAHAWSETWNKDDTYHWHECGNSGCPVTNESGKDGYGEHSYTLETVSEATLKSEATCTSAAVYYKSCECGKISTTDTFTGEYAAHSYTQEIVKPEALKSAATCTSAAVYYKSCECGAVGATDTFESGNALGHTWATAWSKNETHHWHECERSDCPVTASSGKGEYATHSYTLETVSDATRKSPATCTEAAVYYKSCECGAVGATETFTNGNALGHSWAETWSKDETHHWHECSKPGCTLSDNSGKDGYAAHSYTLETVKPEALKSAATCTNAAVYYKSCVCGAISMTDTFTSGKSLGHDFTSGTWQSDADQHWRKCSRCEVTDAKEAHSGGTATCTEKAFCTVCNQPYGELNASNHTGGTEVRGRVEATTSATGYTGDTYCKGCNAKIADGTTIPKKESSSGGGGTTYYRLTFDSNGGSSIQTIRTTYGKTINLSGYIPTRDGYNFIGWYSDKALTQKITEIKLNGSKTVYAGWTKSNPNTGINPFTDVNASDWFYDDVMFVYEKGLMSGISATTFAPYANATRNQIAVIFYRMEGSPAVEGKNSFTDVAYGPGTAWFYDAVTWAQQKGIMGGFGGGKFGPDEQVTREQLASIFYRYAQVKGYDVTNIGSLDSFTDRENVSDWAQEAMKWAVSSGIINGGENNLLDPKGTATRAEIAAMLHRFIEKQELRPVVTPSGTTGWTKPTGGGTSAKSPQTGDSFHTGLWLFTLCASAGAMAVTLIIKRREEEESRQLA